MTVLTKSILPFLDDAGIKKLIALHSPYVSPFQTVLDKEVVTACADILGDSATTEMREEIIKHAEKLDAAKKLAPAPKAKAKPRKVRVLSDAEAASLEVAKAFAPKVPGCVLSMEVEWQSRWRLEYPVEHPPFSRPAVFIAGDVAEQREALMIVLRWGWNHHTRITGEPCPYDLSK